MRTLFILFLLLPLAFQSAEAQSFREFADAIHEEHFDNGALKRAWFDHGSLGLQVISFYPGGSIREIGYLKDGKMHGQWVLWNESGARQGVANYQTGKKVGTWRIWDHQGELVYTIEYAKGRRDVSEAVSLKYEKPALDELASR
jgi:antitoxin component YwqK of YwqJK toxin-antitoxin module